VTTLTRALLGARTGGRRPRNTELVDLLQTFHAVVIASRAKSHCVEWTVSDLLEDLPAERVYLLEDCTSPVVVPGAADFTDEANWAFARFADRGVNIVNSEQPIDTWPRL
jgi:nicotinamidase-related amidase